MDTFKHPIFFDATGLQYPTSSLLLPSAISDK
jgi:hypothetical protein